MTRLALEIDGPSESKSSSRGMTVASFQLTQPDLVIPATRKPRANRFRTTHQYRSKD